jgi:hypothetical protein
VSDRPGQFILCYLINGGKTVNFVAFSFMNQLEGTPLDGPPVRIGTREELVGHFGHWEKDVQILLQVATLFSIMPQNTVSDS